jgi:hypothetical protein
MVCWRRELYGIQGDGISIRKDLSRERQAIAEAVVALSDLLKQLKQQDGRTWTYKTISDWLSRAGFAGMHPSSLTRYRSGENLPPKGFLSALHQVACQQVGPEFVGITKGALLENWRVAKDVRKEVKSLRAEVASLRERIEGLEGQAGLLAGLVATAQETPLPVPTADGDRQRTSYGNGLPRDPAVVRFVSRATELLSEGMHEDVLGVLREAPRLLSPGQNADCVVLFRQGKLDTLADTLIRAFGRDQSDKDVIRLAASLVGTGMIEDAGTLLRLTSA